jgi:hypothetical protein
METICALRREGGGRPQLLQQALERGEVVLMNLGTGNRRWNSEPDGASGKWILSKLERPSSRCAVALTGTNGRSHRRPHGLHLERVLRLYIEISKMDLADPTWRRRLRTCFGRFFANRF